MKNNFAIIFVCCFLFLNSGRSQFSFGLVSGINSSTIKIKGEEQLGFRVGFYEGAYFKHQMNNTIAINYELQYSVEGYKNEVDQLRLGYFRILPHLDFRLIDGFELQAGFNIGRKLFEELKRRERFSATFSTGKSVFYSDYDLGFLVGAKYYFTHFFLSFRYNHGFRDVYKPDTFSTTQNVYKIPAWKNRTFQLGVGFKFNHSNTDKY